MTTNKFSPLQDIIDLDSYQFLQRQSPKFLDGITECLTRGITPAEIRHYMSMSLGPERHALAKRCEEAARHIQRSEEA